MAGATFFHQLALLVSQNRLLKANLPKANMEMSFRRFDNVSRLCLVSTQDQALHLQLDTFKTTVCEKISTETASGAQGDKPQLTEVLKFLRGEDILDRY